MNKAAWAVITFAFIALTIFGVQNGKSSDEQLFNTWKQEFCFSFTNEQQIYRKYIFLQNYRDIISHNANPHKSYEKGLNHFSHLSSDQFIALFTNIRIDKKDATKTIMNVKISEDPSNDIDWTKQGKVSAVKNQGSCDAGYAFCTVSLAQSYFLMKDQNLTLSEQQVIDCSQNYTTFGCSGGSRLGTLNYVKEKGLTAQSKYPWKGVKGICGAPSGGENKVGMVTYEANGCEQIKNRIYTSPMTVAVNARTMQSYKAGIFDGCDSTDVTHDIYLVGVTTTYWKLKNSWGQAWGQYGFMRLKIGNTCGICEKTAYGFATPK